MAWRAAIRSWREEVEAHQLRVYSGDADLDGVVEVALASFEHARLPSDYRLAQARRSTGPSVDREVREVLSLEARRRSIRVESDGIDLMTKKLRVRGESGKADCRRWRPWCVRDGTPGRCLASMCFPSVGPGAFFRFAAIYPGCGTTSPCDLGRAHQYCARCGRPFSAVGHRGSREKLL